MNRTARSGVLVPALLASVSLILSFVAAPVGNALLIDLDGWNTIDRLASPLVRLPVGKLGPFGHDGTFVFNTTLYPSSLRDAEGERLPWTAHMAPSSEGAKRAIAFSALILLVTLGCEPLARTLYRRGRYRNHEGPLPGNAARGRLILLASAAPVAVLAGWLVTAARIAWTGANRDRPAALGVFRVEDFFALGPIPLAMLVGGVLMLVAPAIRWMVVRSALVDLGAGACPACGYRCERFPCPECGHDPGADARSPGRLARALPWIIQAGLVVVLLSGPWLLTVTLGPLLA